MLDEKRLWNEGFVFDKIYLDWEETEDWLDESFYDEFPVQKKGYDVPLRWESISSNCIRNIKAQILNKMPDSISHLVHEMTWDAHLMKQGDYMELHSDAGEGGPFQILIWVCEHNVFKGREFLYGDEGNILERKPQNGLVCFMNTSDPKWLHGVKPLLSDDRIATITGYFS